MAEVAAAVRSGFMSGLPFCLFAFRRTRARVLRGRRSSLVASRASFGEGAGRVFANASLRRLRRLANATRMDAAEAEEVVCG